MKTKQERDWNVDDLAHSIRAVGFQEGIYAGLESVQASYNQLCVMPDSARQKRQRDFVTKEIDRLKKLAGIE